MSLDRVIEEQQKEIDRLRNTIKTNTRAWTLRNQEFDKFMDAFWLFFNNPENSGIRDNMRKVLIEQYYCLSCQQSPCGCSDDGYN